MIECNKLQFEYKHGAGDFALNDVSFEIQPGYFTCLLGHNGAGKTTLLKLLYGMLTPGGGEITLDGKAITSDNLDEYHQRAAYVGEEWCIPFLSGKDNVDTLSVLYPEFDWKLYGSLLKKLDFNEVDTLYFRLSSGQKLKLQLCFQLARRPKYVILDEPLANLDVVAKQDIIEVLQQGINEWNMGVLMSTHLLDEISDVVDYIAVLEEGRLAEYGDREEIFAKHGTDTLRDVIHAT